ncbi:hypothetical protein ACWCO3_18065 [Micromonospora sp. NPDC002411]
MHTRGWFILGFAGLLLFYAFDEFRQTHWRSAFGAVAGILAIDLWPLLTKAAGLCGVLNLNRLGNCRNDINGLFFGCERAKNHYWLRPLGFVGLGRKPKPSRKNAGASESESEPALVAPTQAVADTTPHRILFYATMVSTTFAVVSGLTDLLTFFGKDAA